MPTFIARRARQQVAEGLDHQGVDRRQGDRRRRAHPGRRSQLQAGRRRRGQARRRQESAAGRRARLRAYAGRADRGADRLARRSLRDHHGGGDDERKKHHAARRRFARRDADFRDHQSRGAGYVRAAGLCRQRHPDRALARRARKSSPCVRRRFRQPGRVAPRRSSRPPPRPIPAFPVSSARNFRNRSARN